LQAKEKNIRNAMGYTVKKGSWFC